MKLLFDENLSPKLPRALEDIFPGSAHVHDCGLGKASDATIWDHALTGDFTIVSKDSDFHARLVLAGSPPKLIWLRTGNRNWKHVADLLRRNSVAIHTFGQDVADSFLILS